jgi:ATP-dependent RNA helicase DeaD
MKISELNIKKEIVDGLKDCGYDTLTEIQQAIIDKIIAGQDVLAQAPTGTGKTAAFAIPLVEKLKYSDLQSLVLCPTRELANQIYNEFLKIGKNLKKMRVIPIYGGVPIDKQIRNIANKPQIIISTPGRLLDHIKRKTLDISNIETIVLDEVDEMFNMGFKQDVSRIISNIKSKHQTVLISATLSHDVTNASKSFQNEPFVYKVSTLDKQTNANIEQFFIKVNKNRKNELLEKLINDNQFYLTIIFTNTKYTATWLRDCLQRKNLNAEAIHSNLRQNARRRIMDNFKSGKYKVLIATDIIARGIDVKNIDAVINYEIPQNTESYVHRIGRTGRAGESGKSYLLIDEPNNWFIDKIAKLTNSKINELSFEEFAFENANSGSTSTKTENSDEVRLFMNIGEKDGFDAGSFKDFLVNKFDFDVKKICDIYLKDTYGFITIKKDALEDLNKVKNIDGREIKFSESNKRKEGFSRDNRRGGNGGGFKRNFSPRRNNSNGGSFDRGNRRNNFHSGNRREGGNSGGFRSNNRENGSSRNFHHSNRGEGNRHGGFKRGGKSFTR